MFITIFYVLSTECICFGGYMVAQLSRILHTGPKGKDIFFLYECNFKIFNEKIK